MLKEPDAPPPDDAQFDTGDIQFEEDDDTQAPKTVVAEHVYDIDEQYRPGPESASPRIPPPAAEKVTTENQLTALPVLRLVSDADEEEVGGLFGGTGGHQGGSEMKAEAENWFMQKFMLTMCGRRVSPAMAKKLITAGAASMAMLLIVLISLVVSGSGSSSGQDVMPLGRTSAARVGQLGPGQALTSSYELFRDQVVVDKLSVPARHSKTRHTFKTSFEKEMQRMLGLGAGDVFVTSINRTDDHHALIKFNVKVSNGREAHRVSTKLGKWKMGQLGSNEPAGKRWFYEIASSSGNQVQDLEVVDVESHGTNKDSKGVCHSVNCGLHSSCEPSGVVHEYECVCHFGYVRNVSSTTPSCMSNKDRLDELAKKAAQDLLKEQAEIAAAKKTPNKMTCSWAQNVDFGDCAISRSVQTHSKTDCGNECLKDLKDKNLGCSASVYNRVGGLCKVVNKCKKKKISAYVDTCTPVRSDQLCIDNPMNWLDSAGDNCARYIEDNLCTETGGYGAAWGSSSGGETFAKYADGDGVNAANACCGCGGGARAGNANATLGKDEVRAAEERARLAQQTVVVGEVGTAVLSEKWQAFEMLVDYKAYHLPVIVASVPTHLRAKGSPDAQEYVVRVRPQATRHDTGAGSSATCTGFCFEMRLQRPTCNEDVDSSSGAGKDDDASVDGRQVSWLAIKPGSYATDTHGMWQVGLQAGSVSIPGGRFEAVYFPTPFAPNASVVTVSQVQTVNENHFVKTRHSSVRAYNARNYGSTDMKPSTGFSVALEREGSSLVDTKGQAHGFETVGWVSLLKQVGSFSGGVVPFEAGLTPLKVTHLDYRIKFARTFDIAPHFFASIATFHSGDAGGLRQRGRASTTNVTVNIEEDRCGDTETQHSSEQVAFVALGGKLDQAILKSRVVMRFCNPDVALLAKNGVGGYYTYQLAITLSKRAWNLYSVFGKRYKKGDKAWGQDTRSAGGSLVMPPAWQAKMPFGKDIGGVPAMLVKIEKSAKYDSWLSVGPVDGTANALLKSLNIDFKPWAGKGLQVNDGALFWSIPKQGPRASGGRIVVAQLTVKAAQPWSASVSAMGYDKAWGCARRPCTPPKSWQEDGISFTVERDDSVVL